ncbi:NB-ARC domains-containing protein, partial [Tanacetum coccineum]
MMPYVSSLSSSRLSQGYDVFMSFRGEDTRTGFTSHLYDALIRNDITTYKDDKTLEIGNPIASELLEAIEASRIAIVLFSYAVNWRNEAKVVSEIVKLILKDMPDTLPIDVTNGLVKIDSRMDEVIRLIRMESSEVLFIGICGMSGIGKTTLAEAVFNKLKNKCNKTFEHGLPTHVYEKWSDDIVKLIGGLPLALNVYGS